MSHHSSKRPLTESEHVPDDALTEILLRVSPHPTCLARASVPLKALRSSSPPMLGFFHDDSHLANNFLPIGDSPDRVSAAAFDPKHLGWRVVDSRHGRVLLRSPDRLLFLIWEPMAGSRQYVDAPTPQCEPWTSIKNNAALVCTTTGHHQDQSSNSCHDCPLSVLYVASPCWLWNEVASGVFSPLLVTERPVAMLGNVVYWTMADNGYPRGILGLEVETRRLSLIKQPPYTFEAHLEHVQVIEPQNGMLRLVIAAGLSLQLWALYQYNGVGTEGWELYCEIDLKHLAPLKPMLDFYDPIWILSVQGSVIFLRTEAGIFEVDLQTQEYKRLYDGYNVKAFYTYRSFYRR
ncbi:hypothetical protein BS78_01G260200, partial [Paspalum vaginatum]